MSKKLIYKNEQIATITDEEAQQIMDAKDKRQSHLNFKGELLKTLQIEIRNEKQIKTDKTIYQMNTDELKEIIGEFENEYEQNKTGDIIHNYILGDEFEGIIEWAIEIGAIEKRVGGNIEYWFIVDPTGIEWRRKRDAMRELQERRRFAQGKTIESLRQNAN